MYRAREMPRIQLFLMRHSKSCSNHVRASDTETDIVVSKGIRDPGLTAEGRRVASLYRPRIRNSLKAGGFDIDHCMVTSSKLRRAKETAALVFGRQSRPLPHFAENGAIPENTPAGVAYAAPNWRRFLAHLSTVVRDGQSVVTVGHGSFLLSLWPTLTGHARADRLNNLDGILLDATIGPTGTIQVHGIREITCPFHVRVSVDHCGLGDRQKITTLRRRMGKRSQKQKRTQKKKQRGGGVNMPLAYFQDGAQMRGTEGSETGVGLAGSSSGWIREPLTQTGGRRRTLKGGFRNSQNQDSRLKGGFRNSQNQDSRLKGGFFSPSVMGAFASNGLRLLPAATYMGYRMYTNNDGSQTKLSRRARRRSSRI
jgi:phosphohistidine phosphatase SixA